MRPRKKYAVFGAILGVVAATAEHFAVSYITEKFLMPLSHGSLKFFIPIALISLCAWIGWYLGGESQSQDGVSSSEADGVRPEVKVTRLGAIASKVHVLGHAGSARIRDFLSIGTETIIKGPESNRTEPGKTVDEKNRGARNDLRSQPASDSDH
jgi:hypothetical protein